MTIISIIDEFYIFLLSFEQVLCDIIAINALFVLVTGDFDAIVANWWKNDTTTTKVLKSILFLLRMVLVRSFLTKFVFFLILLRGLNLLLQTNLT